MVGDIGPDEDGQKGNADDRVGDDPLFGGKESLEFFKPLLEAVHGKILPTSHG